MIFQSFTIYKHTTQCNYVIAAPYCYIFLLQQQSGGTVLSTNWADIGKKDVDIKPPDGMEFKKWD